MDPSENLRFLEGGLVNYYCTHVAMSKGKSGPPWGCNTVAVDDRDTDVGAASYSIHEVLASPLCAYSVLGLVADGECSHLVTS